MSATDVKEFIADLDGNVFEQTLGNILSQVAAGAIDHQAKGQVVITLDMKPLNNHQVHVSHKLFYKRPTSKGDQSENATSVTPMYVGNGGKLSIFPENQTQMFTKQGEVNEDQQS